MHFKARYPKLQSKDIHINIIDCIQNWKRTFRRGLSKTCDIGLRLRNGVGTEIAGLKKGSGDSLFICESFSEC